MIHNFCDHLLSHGRQLRRLGQNPQAMRVLNRLVALRDLPGDIVEEAHRELAELRLEQGKYGLARRALAVALARRPDEASYHFLMAIAILDDPKGQSRRALAHLNEALRLDPDNVECHLEVGMLALSLGKPRRGCTSLRRAAELAPDDPEVLGKVAGGLRGAGKSDEARRLLRAAMFRHPRDHRFRDLWNRHQFELLHAAQEREATTWKPAEKRPVILKFVKPRRRVKVGDRIVRTDGPETTGPKLLSVRLSPRKKAK